MSKFEVGQIWMLTSSYGWGKDYSFHNAIGDKVKVIEGVVKSYFVVQHLATGFTWRLGDDSIAANSLVFVSATEEIVKAECKCSREQLFANGCVCGHIQRYVEQPFV